MSEPKEPLTRLSRETRKRSSGISPKQLAMVVLFGSLSMLFGASIVGYLITREQNVVWRTASMPGLPRGLLVSAAILVVLSFSMRRALRAVRANRFERLQQAILVAILCAVVFVVVQILNWRVMYAATTAVGARTLYGFTFYMLTGLHAAHVLGGFVPLAVVRSKAKRREYSSSNYEGVKLCAQYWDYLLVVWMILLAALYFGT